MLVSGVRRRVKAVTEISLKERGYISAEDRGKGEASLLRVYVGWRLSWRCRGEEEVFDGG